MRSNTSQLVTTLPSIILQFELVGKGAYLAVATRKNCNTTCNTTANVNHDRGSIYLFLISNLTNVFVLGDTGLANTQDLTNYPGYFHMDTVIFLKSFGDNLFASTSRDQTVKVWNLTAILSSTASVGAPLTLKCQFGKVFRSILR